MYNCSTGTINPLTCSEFRRFTLCSVEKFPSNLVLMYPSVKLRYSRFIFKLEVVLYHHLPGLMMDAIAKLQGRKPMIVSDSRNRTILCID